MCYTVNEIIIMKGGTPMKHTKKLRAKNLLALLLAAIIGLGLSIPAMAEEPAFDEAPAIEVIEKLPAPEEPAVRQPEPVDSPLEPVEEEDNSYLEESAPSMEVEESPQISPAADEQSRNL